MSPIRQPGGKRFIDSNGIKISHTQREDLSVKQHVFNLTINALPNDAGFLSSEYKVVSDYAKIVNWIIEEKATNLPFVIYNQKLLNIVHL